MKILAIDPGLATCGWAVLDHAGRVIDLGVLLSNPSGCDEHIDRARRIQKQGAALREQAVGHGCSIIAAEAMSFGGAPKARFQMAVSLGLSWGGIAAIATSLGCLLYSVPPKVWEHAAQPDAGKKINYARLEAALSAFVTQHAAVALQMIAKSKRNHALDAVGIGLLVALRPEQADRIVNGRAAT